MDACPLNDVEIMGGETMFDLKVQLEKWRLQLASNEAYQESDIDELETHLMEEVDNLKTKDLSEEEAFLLASNRVGSTDTLNQEFKKINSKYIWKKRILWFLGGYLFFTIFRSITRFAADIFMAYDGIRTGFGAIIFSTVNLLLPAVILYLILSTKVRTFFSNKLSKRIKQLKTYQIVIMFSLIMIIIVAQFYGISDFIFKIIANINSESLNDTVQMIFNLLNESIWFSSLFIAFFILSLTINRKKKKIIQV